MEPIKDNPTLDDISNEYYGNVLSEIKKKGDLLNDDEFYVYVTTLSLANLHDFVMCIHIGEQRNVSAEFTAGYIYGCVAGTTYIKMMERDIKEKFEEIEKIINNETE